MNRRAFLATLAGAAVAPKLPGPWERLPIIERYTHVQYALGFRVSVATNDQAEWLSHIAGHLAENAKRTLEQMARELGVPYVRSVTGEAYPIRVVEPKNSRGGKCRRRAALTHPKLNPARLPG